MKRKVDLDSTAVNKFVQPVCTGEGRWSCGRIVSTVRGSGGV